MIKYSKVKKIHFVGIGGSGMSGIAEVLHNMGFTISGSDLAENDMVNRLKRIGVRVDLGHSKDNIKDVETLVYSSAIKSENVEVKEALSRKIPVIPRAEMLAELMRLKYSLAVAGTHGKTTTTSMIASVLTTAQKDPTFVVGGKLKIEESGAKLGKSDYLIAEADESDGSFLKLYPTIAVITNIEDDHLDYYGSMENLREAFRDFGNKVPFYGTVILNYECENSREILPLINKKVLSYSISHDTYVRAVKIKNSAFGLSFNLIVDGKDLGSVQLKIGGIHNVLNALAAITACLEVNIDIETIKKGMKRFHLPERRFQVLFFNDDYTVIDDYAHHPTEVKVTLETLKNGDFNRIIAVFQPHRYTRLELLMDKFASSFGLADQVLIAKLYSANQNEIAEVNSEILVNKIKSSGNADSLYIDDFQEIKRFLKKEIRKGDAIVFLSAGNLTRVAHDFAKILEGSSR
jgi:UDP-N-acetylmuramate--alanine ligase